MEVEMPTFKRPGMWNAVRACGTVVALLAVSARPSAQLASRPAADWAATLDSAERIAGLRVDEVVASLKLRDGDVVADLGAGTGPFIEPLARAVSPGGRIYAVDIDAGFFPYIERRAKQAGLGNVRTVLGEFVDPKLPAADVDVAFFHDVLHHIDNRAAYLTNLVKYLKRDARIVVIDYNPAQSPHRDQPALQVSRAETDLWLAKAGFKPVQELGLFADKWFVIYSR
jgi:ubiquinone/menaquinone biosynthesis C-methylase UbiE